MQEKTLSGWEDLARLADQHSREKWLYRGVTRCDHELMPKIARGGARAMDIPYDVDHERFLLEEFKRQARPLVTSRPDTDLEWLALAQHHGLYTRLLDWSESILVAAMFATESGVTTLMDFRTGEKQDVPPAIYGIQDLPEIASDVDPFSIEAVYFYRPAHISPRIAPQHAAFTVHPAPLNKIDGDNIVRWTLDIKGTLDLKQTLDAVGISRATLFPGIDGLAGALNWRYKWNTLRV